MINTIDSVVTADPLVIVIPDERYEVDVDYSIGIDDYRAMLRYRSISCDSDVRCDSLVHKNQKDFKAQRTFALAYGNHLCCRDDYEKAIRAKGWCLVNYHEALSFAAYYQEHKMRQSIAALDALFRVKGFGEHALTITYNYDAPRVEVGLKLMRLKVHPKFAHLIVLNEAISPIL